MTMQFMIGGSFEKSAPLFRRARRPVRELPNCTAFVIGSELHIGTIRMLGRIDLTVSCYRAAPIKFRFKIPKKA
jgi:hypothetical protein